MASSDNDPEEFTGATATIKADPKGSKRAAPAPAPTVAVYVPPVDGEAHPKHARLGPAQRLDAAEAALTAAQLELSAAYQNLRNVEREETAAHAEFIRSFPAPTADEVNRKRLAAEMATKLQRVQNGESPNPSKPVTARSPIDLAASQRPRTSAQAPSNPLRSNVVRRNA
jgi:hypothetical protein